MSEKINEKHEKSNAEKPELKNLELSKSKEKKPIKAEVQKKESELAQKGHEAEKVLRAEKEKHKLELAKEKEKAEKEKHEKPEREEKPPAKYTKAEKKTAYKKEIKKVQNQLPKRSRTFSKFVHNPVVESVSDVAGKTIFRPSVLIGGSVTGLVLGLVVYIVAVYYGYLIPSITLVLFLLVGAVLGAVVEFIFHRFRHPEKI